MVGEKWPSLSRREVGARRCGTGLHRVVRRQGSNWETQHPLRYGLEMPVLRS